jgi:hypothetical protein
MSGAGLGQIPKIRTRMVTVCLMVSTLTLSILKEVSLGIFTAP